MRHARIRRRSRVQSFPGCRQFPVSRRRYRGDESELPHLTRDWGAAATQRPSPPRRMLRRRARLAARCGTTGQIPQDRAVVLADGGRAFGRACGEPWPFPGSRVQAVRAPTQRIGMEGLRGRGPAVSVADGTRLPLNTLEPPNTRRRIVSRSFLPCQLASNQRATWHPRNRPATWLTLRQIARARQSWTQLPLTPEASRSRTST